MTRLRLLAVVCGLAVLAGACTLPGRVQGPVELTATFDDVGDLVAGHSVQVADVRVGSITKIVLTDDFRAAVTMKVKDGLELPADSVAVLRTTSLLGEKFVELRPLRTGDDCDDTDSSGVLESGDVVGCAIQAPELEFVAEEAVNVLAGVVTNDLASLIETGAVGFGGRAAELGTLLDSLAVVSSTMADQTGNIVRIVDGLDQATSTLATSSGKVDQLLVNLADTAELLSDNRELTLQTLRDLTRLARDQNDLVFEPYQADLERQVAQLDGLLAAVVGQREEVGVLIDWLAKFTLTVPKGIPDDFAQVYGWFQPAVTEGAP